MLRRIVRQVGFVTLTKVVWEHRGTVVRTVDFGTRVPQRVRRRDTKDALTEVRAILALDQEAPSDTDIRISGVEDGAIMLRGTLTPARLALARQALLPVRDVLDVRTDAGDQPTLDDELAAAV
jgi:hypothetical protein